MGTKARLFLAALAAWAGLLTAAGPSTGARAQDAAQPENLMKACGDKWRAVKAAESAKGVTWPQFLASCRAEPGRSAQTAQASQAQVASPQQVAPSQQVASPPQAQVAAPPPGSPQRAAPRSRPAAAEPSANGPVFPAHVADKHAGERPQVARQRTCSEQFRANKAANANGGLRWVEKGGGYWSQCNAHLKQVRA